MKPDVLVDRNGKKTELSLAIIEIVERFKDDTDHLSGIPQLS